ncbi:MAG: hypothetical protein WBW94_06065 [Anaerolineales bacterium]
MSKRKWIVLLSSLSLLFAMLACNIGVRKPAPTLTNVLPSSISVSVEPSLTETQTATELATTESTTSIPATNTIGAPTSTPTPQNPLVTTTAYCWSGPTSTKLKYEVISSIQAGTRVQLLGQGIVEGWWVIRDPRYGDPCWIQQQDVQLDPSYDLSTLQTFAVPSTPTATP